MSRYPAGRNQANAPLAFRIGHKQQHPAFRHADDDKSLLAIIPTIVETFDGKRVPEYCCRQLEADAVVAEVGLSLGIVPFKLQFHDTTAAWVGCALVTAGGAPAVGPGLPGGRCVGWLSRSSLCSGREGRRRLAA